ncbi:MAG: hypothetical protein QOJ52_4221, partial [Acidimicrobiaceae bacterium]|nr:hypothetical protein [Acidimicrobiaceae bacterium]
GREETVLCALLLAAWCSGLELISLQRGWTTFDLAHAIAGIVIAPLTIIISALLLL